MRTSLPKKTVNIICVILIAAGLVILAVGEAYGIEALKWISLVLMISFLPFRFAFLRCPHCYRYLDHVNKGNTCPWCGREIPQ